MPVFLRAIVMLAVLVGLPAGWAYFGPLPPSAQRVVDRVVDSAKGLIGTGQEATPALDLKSAPTFDQLTDVSQSQQPQAADSATATPSEFASLLEQLRSLGAAEYRLQKWGQDGQLYRFRCEMPLAESTEVTRHFEAVGSDPVASIAQVVGEVALWYNARTGRQEFH